MKALCIAAGLSAVSLFAGQASAATVTLDFPGVGTEWISQGNGESGTLAGGDRTQFMYVAGDYVRQSFADTGLGFATSLSASFEIENVQDIDQFVDVLINGITVGQFTVPDCDFCFAVQTITFDLTFAAITGDDFDLEYRLASTVPPGLGSFAFFSGGTATLSDGAGGVVPEPASWAMMIAGFGLVGAALRRRQPVLASA